MKIDLKRQATALAVAVAALIWLVAFGGYAAPGVASGNAREKEVLYLLVTAGIGFGLSLAFYGAVMATAGRTTMLRLTTAAAVLAAAVLVHSAADLWMIEHYLRQRPVMGPNALLDPHALLYFNNVLLLSPAHVTYAIGVGLGLSLRAVHEREQRLAAALAAAQEAQIAALRFQINPHFLFNSLNAVMSLVGSGRNRDAENVVARLAAFFRATLASEPNAMVSLEEELDVLGAYLDIEAARFGDRLRVDIELPDDLIHARVPHFLLQPLAENAIKHGVAPSKRPVTLSVTARADRGRLTVAVRDDGAGGAGAAGEGVGLRNVAGRLGALYGEAATFQAEKLATGFQAVVELPLTLMDPDS